MRREPATSLHRRRPGPSSSGSAVGDSGVENVNAGVDQLMADGIVRRVLAQVEVSFSNSMIEAFWRSLHPPCGSIRIHSKASRSSSSSSISTFGSTTRKCPIMLLMDKRRTRSTSAKVIASTIASRPPGVRLVGREWRRPVVNPVVLARHPLIILRVLTTPSQMHRRDSRMFSEAAVLETLVSHVARAARSRVRRCGGSRLEGVMVPTSSNTALR